MSSQVQNPNWFTAAEIASIVTHCAISCFPATESGVIRWIRRQAQAFPDSFGKACNRLSRKRPGRGGPTEFHLWLFDVHGIQPLLIALEAAALQRKEGTFSRAEPQDDLLLLNDDDTALMRSMLPDDFYVSIDSFSPLKPRSVRRCMIELRTERYYSGAFHPYERRKVLVTSYREIVFAWRCDGSGHRLACHGKAGLIDMIRKPLEKTGLYPDFNPFKVNYSTY